MTKIAPSMHSKLHPPKPAYWQTPAAAERIETRVFERASDVSATVAREIADQLADGESRVFGVMVESHLVAGRQDLVAGRELTYGQSITDACLGWDDTLGVLETLAEGVVERRVALSN